MKHDLIVLTIFLPVSTVGVWLLSNVYLFLTADIGAPLPAGTGAVLPSTAVVLILVLVFGFCALGALQLGAACGQWVAGKFAPESGDEEDDGTNN